jgi:hypothetical protein
VIIANFDKREHIKACKQLPSRVDIVRLQAEVQAIPVEYWDNQRAPVHQHTRSVFLKGYPPALGKADDPEQPILELCPYVHDLMRNLFPGRVGKCLLASLQPGAMVYPHTDNANDYFVRSCRIHVPVFTNQSTHIFCNGQFFHMAEGEAWMLNNLAPHAVINDHANLERVHLIFDVFPDKETVKMTDALPEADGRIDAWLFARLMTLSRPSENQNS